MLDDWPALRRANANMTPAAGVCRLDSTLISDPLARTFPDVINYKLMSIKKSCRYFRACALCEKHRRRNDENPVQTQVKPIAPSVDQAIEVRTLN